MLNEKFKKMVLLTLIVVEFYVFFKLLSMFFAGEGVYSDTDPAGDALHGQQKVVEQHEQIKESVGRAENEAQGITEGIKGLEGTLGELEQGNSDIESVIEDSRAIIERDRGILEDCYKRGKES